MWNKLVGVLRGSKVSVWFKPLWQGALIRVARAVMAWLTEEGAKEIQKDVKKAGKGISALLDSACLKLKGGIKDSFIPDALEPVLIGKVDEFFPLIKAKLDPILADGASGIVEARFRLFMIHATAQLENQIRAL